MLAGRDMGRFLKDVSMVMNTEARVKTRDLRSEVEQQLLAVDRVPI